MLEDNKLATFKKTLSVEEVVCLCSLGLIDVGEIKIHLVIFNISARDSEAMGACASSRFRIKTVVYNQIPNAKLTTLILESSAPWSCGHFLRGIRFEISLRATMTDEMDAQIDWYDAITCPWIPGSCPHQKSSRFRTKVFIDLPGGEL